MCPSRKRSPTTKPCSPYYLGLCRAGELTGRIDTVLEQLAEYMEHDLEARAKVRSALTYPAIVLMMSFVTVGVLVGVVLPKFAKFFDEFHAKLPPTTRALIATSHVITTYWFVFPVLGIAIASTVVWMRRSPGGRSVRDRLLLRRAGARRRRPVSRSSSASAGSSGR